MEAENFNEFLNFLIDGDESRIIQPQQQYETPKVIIEYQKIHQLWDRFTQIRCRSDRREDKLTERYDKLNVEYAQQMGRISEELNDLKRQLSENRQELIEQRSRSRRTGIELNDEQIEMLRLLVTETVGN